MHEPRQQQQPAPLLNSGRGQAASASPSPSALEAAAAIEDPQKSPSPSDYNKNYYLYQMQNKNGESSSPVHLNINSETGVVSVPGLLVPAGNGKSNDKTNNLSHVGALQAGIPQPAGTAIPSDSLLNQQQQQQQQPPSSTATTSMTTATTPQVSPHRGKRKATTSTSTAGGGGGEGDGGGKGKRSSTVLARKAQDFINDMTLGLSGPSPPPPKRSKSSAPSPAKSHHTQQQQQQVTPAPSPQKQKPDAKQLPKRQQQQQQQLRKWQHHHTRGVGNSDDSLSSSPDTGNSVDSSKVEEESMEDVASSPLVDPVEMAFATARDAQLAAWIEDGLDQMNNNNNVNTAMLSSLEAAFLAECHMLTQQAPELDEKELEKARAALAAKCMVFPVNHPGPPLLHPSIIHHFPPPRPPPSSKAQHATNTNVGTGTNVSSRIRLTLTSGGGLRTATGGATPGLHQNVQRRQPTYTSRGPHAATGGGGGGSYLMPPYSVPGGQHFSVEQAQHSDHLASGRYPRRSGRGRKTKQDELYVPLDSEEEEEEERSNKDPPSDDEGVNAEQFKGEDRIGCDEEDAINNSTGVLQTNAALYQKQRQRHHHAQLGSPNNKTGRKSNSGTPSRGIHQQRYNINTNTVQAVNTEPSDGTVKVYVGEKTQRARKGHGRANTAATWQQTQQHQYTSSNRPPLSGSAAAGAAAGGGLSQSMLLHGLPPSATITPMSFMLSLPGPSPDVLSPFAQFLLDQQQQQQQQQQRQNSQGGGGSGMLPVLQTPASFTGVFGFMEPSFEVPPPSSGGQVELAALDDFISSLNFGNDALLSGGLPLFGPLNKPPSVSYPQSQEGKQKQLVGDGSFEPLPGKFPLTNHPTSLPTTSSQPQELEAQREQQQQSPAAKNFEVTPTCGTLSLPPHQHHQHYYHQYQHPQGLESLIPPGLSLPLPDLPIRPLDTPSIAGFLSGDDGHGNIIASAGMTLGLGPSSGGGHGSGSKKTPCTSPLSLASPSTLAMAQLTSPKIFVGLSL